MKHTAKNIFRHKSIAINAILCMLAFLFSIPAVYMVIQSLVDAKNSYFHLMSENQVFFQAYQNTIFICVASLFGQLLVSILGGWGLARYCFPGRKALLFLCGVLILIPTQALLLPQYLMLRELHLLDNLWGLILLQIFSPLGSVLMWRGFSAIPREVIESAESEGAKLFTVLLKIAIPMCRKEIRMVTIISIAESWNLLEQAMAYIKTQALYPISVYLSTASIADKGQLFAACTLTLLPVAVVFITLTNWPFHERENS